MRNRWLASLVLGAVVGAGCAPAGPRVPRMSFFVGVDVSRSFLEGPHYADAMKFLSHYIEAHMKGLGGLERPATLFVGPIGGMKADEAKTFFPIQTFQDKSAREIESKLREIFPRATENPTTDFNAFFDAIAEIVKSRKLVLRPITIVMVSDGKPYVKEYGGSLDFRQINLKPLEKLSRNVTVRLLYTDAVTGKGWQTQVPRRNIRVWTQDADVMAYWKDPGTFLPDTAFEAQEKYFAWLKDNVDFGVRARRVE